MYTLRLLLLLCCFIQVTHAQVQIGINSGIANYEGDLDDEPFRPLRPAFGINAGYSISNHFLLRTGYTFAKVAGADKYGSGDFQRQTRNLSFESNIHEFNLVGEFKLFNIDDTRWSPYVMGGIAIFQYNPYTYTLSGDKVYLKPLSTEGEGLPEYPDRKPYSLTQFALPFGGGIKYMVNDNVEVGLELGIRKLFTDYLDDISTTYIDPNVLAAEKGRLAVDLYYRGDEVMGETYAYPDQGYPSIGSSRGSPKGKDWYYLSVIHLSFKLNKNDAGKHYGVKRKGYGCPAVPY